MKRIVSISLGSNHRDHAVTLSLRNEQVKIERIGVHGDYSEAKKLFEQLDGKVSVFGLGGIDYTIGLDKQIKIPTAYKIIKNDRSKTWIASPCPTLVQTIRSRYPHLLENLIPVHSPMGCMSLICKKHFPEHKYVFIGPCLTKKVEARELPYVELALTFRELEQIFKEKKVRMHKVRNLLLTSFTMTIPRFIR